MDPALQAAAEINAMWTACLDGKAIENPNCPSNEQVAAVIRKHFPSEGPQ